MLININMINSHLKHLAKSPGISASGIFLGEGKTKNGLTKSHAFFGEVYDVSESSNFQAGGVKRANKNLTLTRWLMEKKSFGGEVYAIPILSSVTIEECNSVHIVVI